MAAILVLLMARNHAVERHHGNVTQPIAVVRYPLLHYDYGSRSSHRTPGQLNECLTLTQ